MDTLPQNLKYSSQQGFRETGQERPTRKFDLDHDSYHHNLAQTAVVDGMRKK